ncbi:arylesterase [Pontibacter oryzae]|uniref:Arylesterase n=1 Tax=Pontibacter oryzae TaxID=2304593 RepID=A0A399SGI4_9BACT|nr:arylesterase [Pontibacter oryzae]RIJ41663.1 arylesterase [Pontibacter oryzae]
MNIKNKVLAIACATVVGLVACNEVDSTSETESADRTETAENTEPSTQKSSETQTILFFGNSLTAGYGLEPDQAFPALIQQRIDSLNLPYKVVNAGVSGETTAGGKSRVDWLLKKPVDIFILELGANDGLRGINLSESYANLKTIIEKVRAKNPDVKIVLAGMQIPPSMGQKYTSEFKEMYTRIAAEENVLLIPFLLEGVAGDPELNQADGIHPTVEGQKILADNVWEVLEPALLAEEAA